MHPMLNTAIKAARRAGNIINRASLDLERLQVVRKGPKDYVTEVDQAAEEAIIDILRTAYPDHGFLGEESGEHLAQGQAIDSQAEFQWIIDPLDGTTNFIHGLPIYAVSIALAHRGRSGQQTVVRPFSRSSSVAARFRASSRRMPRPRLVNCAHYSAVPTTWRWPSTPAMRRRRWDSGAAGRPGSVSCNNRLFD